MGTDVLSRFLRVVPVRSKIAPDAAKAFKKMIEKVQLQKIWSDKGTEFKGAFKKNPCDKRGKPHIQQPQKQSQLRGEKLLFPQKHHVQTHGEQMDISLHQQAISICQHNQPTRESCNKVSPKNVTKKHEYHLRSLAAEQSSKFVKKPIFILRYIFG